MGSGGSIAKAQAQGTLGDIDDSITARVPPPMDNKWRRGREARCWDRVPGRQESAPTWARSCERGFPVQVDDDLSSSEGCRI